MITVEQAVEAMRFVEGDGGLVVSGDALAMVRFGMHVDTEMN